MLRESCRVLSPATADKLRQRRSSGRVRGRLASDGATIQHTPGRPLFRLHLDADTFVGIYNSLAVICSMSFRNMFLNHIGKPSIYLPACTMIWGLMSILTGQELASFLLLSSYVFVGTARDFTGALISRFFLGFVEASFFPGALFLLSKWYKRSELGLRTAVLSSGLLISNAFGSLMASGILSGMQGKLGFAAWRSVVLLRRPNFLTVIHARWLFFIEGALTILVAVVAVFVLPDFPHKSHWLLSSEELRLVEVRMQEDAGLGGSDEIDCKDSHVPASGLLEALSDWRVYWLALANASLIISLSFNAFFPTLTETLGYSPTVTLLLCAPPWIFATVVALAVSR